MSRHTHIGHRSAKNGRFVKENYARRHPDKTVKESIPNPDRGDTSRGRKR